MLFCETEEEEGTGCHDQGGWFRDGFFNGVGFDQDVVDAEGFVEAAL